MKRLSYWWLALAVVCGGCEQQTELTTLPPGSPPYLIGDTAWDEAAEAQVTFHLGVEELVKERTP